MKKILLNGYKMNDAIAILQKASKEDVARFKIECGNCTLSLYTGGQPGMENRVEVALRNANDTGWYPLEMDGYTLDRPIIRDFPLTLFAAFVHQIKTNEECDYSAIWNAYDTIASLYNWEE